jgi:hypothetical protein
MADAVTFMVEDAQIIWRNFGGAERQYNPAGDRNFTLVLSEEQAQFLTNEGWNVKVREPREEGDDPLLYIKVTVGFKFKPPRITMITDGVKPGDLNRVSLDEHTCEILDYASIKSVDVICRAYDWVINGKPGRSAYLQNIVVIIEEDELERKWGLNNQPVSAFEEGSGGE